MRTWIVKFWEPSPEHNCKSHRDRPAIAVLQKQEEEDGPVFNMRYYCLACLLKQQAKDPEIPVERPLDISQE